MAKQKKPTKKEMLKHVEVAKEQLNKIPTTKVKSSFQGFVDFVREQGVVGLAIGVVLGVQAKALVDQLVVSFINPILGLILPGKGTLAEKHFALTLNNKTQEFTWGAFMYQFITFVLVAAVVYLVFMSLRLDKLDKKKG